MSRFNASNVWIQSLLGNGHMWNYIKSFEWKFVQIITLLFTYAFSFTRNFKQKSSRTKTCSSIIKHLRKYIHFSDMYYGEATISFQNLWKILIYFFSLLVLLKQKLCVSDYMQGNAKKKTILFLHLMWTESRFKHNILVIC